MFDFSRMTGISFERLVRALAFAQFGPKGVVFSSGRDGARDFTLDGDIPGYPGWSGYLVLQAKFCETLTSPRANVSWLLRQIRSEQKKYADAGRALRIPQYYVIATNVDLSGADGGKSGGAGGLTKITAELNKWKRDLGVRDVDVWHMSKVQDLLASSEGVRRAFAAWTTPGDVLSAVLDKLKPGNLSFGHLIRRALKESLRRDRHARLRDGGDVADPVVRTSQVFIDLPVDIPATLGATLSQDAQEDSDAEISKVANVVAQLTKLSKNRLSSEDLQVQQDRTVHAIGTTRTPCSRVVIVGGPGQGKSTIGTFLAQIFRALLLKDDPNALHDPNVADLAPEILQRAQYEGIDLNLPRRYPVLVSLPRFADAISDAKQRKKAPPTLLAQIARDLSQASDATIERNDLREWLGEYPWLVVLDGLDEVPPSGERTNVLEAISSLLSEFADLKADVLLVVTTRPQGYNKDLEPSVWEHWRLVDLTPERALEYARVLGSVRHAGDQERQSSIMVALRRAAQKSTTARLMISPLQVTIMHLIADTGGSVPAARWSLFSEYFEVLRRREKAKGGVTQKALERNWATLGPIHQIAGLILQAESEVGGGAGASLEHSRFRKLLEMYLGDQGYEQDEISTRVSELMHLALHRLVLLSTREEGRVGFDVRSLQEFMAAAAITSQDATLTGARLEHIAGMAHWRHVFLIAASRCFAEDVFHHRRAAVAAIPRILDVSRNDYLVRNGARLALEMLADGIAVDHPLSRRQLAQHALELLLLGYARLDDDVAEACDATTVATVEDFILLNIDPSNGVLSLSSWSLLLGLASKNARFLRIAEDRWPRDPQHAVAILEFIGAPLPSHELVDKAACSVRRAPPSAPPAFLSSARLRRRGRSKVVDHTPLSRLFVMRSAGDVLTRLSVSILSGARDAGLVASAVSVDAPAAIDLLEYDDFHPEWEPILSVLRFYQDPSPETLAASLESYADSPDPSRVRRWVQVNAPWPIATCVASVRGVDRLRELAALARQGVLGDAEIWRTAEERWKNARLSEEDLTRAAHDHLPFDRDVARCGACNLDQVGYLMSDATPSVVVRIAQIVDGMDSCVVEKRLVRIVQSAIFGVVESGSAMAEDDVKSLLRVICRVPFAPGLSLFNLVPRALWRDPTYADMLAGLAERSYDRDPGHLMTNLDPLIDALQENTSRRGLLCLIVRFAAQHCGVSDNFAGDVASRISYLLVDDEGDSPQVAAAVAVLGAAHGNPVDTLPERLARFVLDHPENVQVRDLVYDVLATDLLSERIRTAALAAMVGEMQRSFSPWASTFCRLLKGVLDARRARLMNRDVWIDKLGLPEIAFALMKPGG